MQYILYNITVSIPIYQKYSAKLQGDRLLGHLVLGRFDGHPGLRGSQFDHRHLWISSTSDHHLVANSWYLHLSEYETRKQWNFYSDSRRNGWGVFWVFVGWEVGMLRSFRMWCWFDISFGELLFLIEMLGNLCFFLRVTVVVQVCRLVSKWTLSNFDAYYDTWFLYCQLALHNACPWMCCCCVSRCLKHNAQGHSSRILVILSSFWTRDCIFTTVHNICSYIYIYMCVCVCVCIFKCMQSSCRGMSLSHESGHPFTLPMPPLSLGQPVGTAPDLHRGNWSAENDSYNMAWFLGWKIVWLSLSKS